MAIESVENRHDISYIIEHLCGDGTGCEVHEPGTWREDVHLSRRANMSRDYAEVLFERHKAQNPKSTYRLVEKVEKVSVTREVVAQ